MTDPFTRRRARDRATTAYEEVQEASHAVNACLAHLDEDTEAHQQVKAVQLMLWAAVATIRRDLAALTKEKP